MKLKKHETKKNYEAIASKIVQRAEILQRIKPCQPNLDDLRTKASKAMRVLRKWPKSFSGRLPLSSWPTLIASLNPPLPCHCHCYMIYNTGLAKSLVGSVRMRISAKDRIEKQVLEFVLPKKGNDIGPEILMALMASRETALSHAVGIDLALEFLRKDGPGGTDEELIPLVQPLLESLHKCDSFDTLCSVGSEMDVIVHAKRQEIMQYIVGKAVDSVTPLSLVLQKVFTFDGNLRIDISKCITVNILKKLDKAYAAVVNIAPWLSSPKRDTQVYKVGDKVSADIK